MSDLIFNVFGKDYRLIVTFTDEIACKTWLQNPTSYYSPAWVAVCHDGEVLKTVPMWEPQEFIDKFNL